MIISGYITNGQIAANLLIDIDKASQATGERGEHPIRRLVTPSLEASSTIDWTWRSRPMIHLSRLPFHLRFGRATALAVDGLGTALRTSATATPVRT